MIGEADQKVGWGNDPPSLLRRDYTISSRNCFPVSYRAGDRGGFPVWLICVGWDALPHPTSFRAMVFS